MYKAQEFANFRKYLPIFACGTNNETMITLYDFHAMTMPEKAAAVWEGTLIGDRPEGDLFVQLYNLGTFYAEVFYNPEINEIVKVRGFKSTRLIEPYLKAIKITF